MPQKEWLKKIHSRLLAGDPTASAELAEALLDELTAELRSRNPAARPPEVVPDAITDALMAYIKDPATFDPGKLDLRAYLLMSAQGDLRNELAKRERVAAKLTFTEDVELLEDGGNKDLEAPDYGTQIDAEKATKVLEDLFPDPSDRTLAELVIAGERSTEAFAGVLGIDDAPPEDKRAEVKRHKDRIKKRLDRRLAEMREEEGSA